jgi:hypothetical protein
MTHERITPPAPATIGVAHAHRRIKDGFARQSPPDYFAHRASDSPVALLIRPRHL